MQTTGANVLKCSLNHWTKPKRQISGCSYKPFPFFFFTPNFALLLGCADRTLNNIRKNLLDIQAGSLDLLWDKTSNGHSRCGIYF